MSFCIVVARYNENVTWTEQFTNVIIYNKGTKLSDIKKTQEVYYINEIPFYTIKTWIKTMIKKEELVFDEKLLSEIIKTSVIIFIKLHQAVFHFPFFKKWRIRFANPPFFIVFYTEYCIQNTIY
jgi:hypothetical protein